MVAISVGNFSTLGGDNGAGGRESCALLPYSTSCLDNLFLPQQLFYIAICYVGLCLTSYSTLIFGVVVLIQ